MIIKIFKRIIYIIVPAGIAFFIIYPLLAGKNIYPLSEYDIYKSFMVNFIETLKRGELPVWNEYVGCGSPALCFGHYPISQNTIIYILLGFSDFTYYFTRFLNLSILFITFIYACRFLKFNYLISLIGALVYFSVNFVTRILIAETIGNLVLVYPLLIIFIIKIIDEKKAKDILIFNLFYMFWLSGGHIIYVYMHLIMLSLIYLITVYVYHGMEALKSVNIRKFIILYFVLFVIPFLGALYQYYFIYDVISVSNRLKEGLIISPFKLTAWKQLIVSFQSSSYFWAGMAMTLIYAILKFAPIGQFNPIKTVKIKITPRMLLSFIVLLLCPTILNVKLTSYPRIIEDFIPILNSGIFRTALLFYSVMHIRRYVFSISLGAVFVFIVYIFLLSYYFYLPKNIEGYDASLLTELSIPFQVLFVLSVLFSSKQYKDNKTVRIMVLSSIVLYFLRSHFTIPLMRFTGIIWYAPRDGSIFSVFFAILFMYGLKNILSHIHILKIKDARAIKYMQYVFMTAVLILSVRDSFNKFYKGTSHRYVYPNKMETAITPFEKWVLEGKQNAVLLNNKLLELDKTAKHFYRVFTPDVSYIYLGGALQHSKICEAFIYESSISKDFKDFYDYIILKKGPNVSNELKDAIPYYLFTKHVHAGLGLSPSEIPYHDFFMFFSRDDASFLQMQNIEFLWDMMQVKYLVIGPHFSNMLKNLTNKECYRLIDEYPKLDLMLYEIGKEKSYSRLAVLPIDNGENYEDEMNKINSNDINVLKDVYSRLVFLDKKSDNFSLLKDVGYNGKRQYEIYSKREGILIDFESWNRNWELKINNSNEKLSKAFHIFKGIKICQGLNRIELLYNLKYFNVLFFVSLFIILIHIVLLGRYYYMNNVAKEGREYRMNNIGKRKIWYFKFIYIFIMLFVLLLTLEGIVYLFHKAGRVRLATRDEIFSISRTDSEEDKAPLPTYIPHPYFGYMYNPGTRISQFNYVSNTPVYMDSNSEGFIDEEFPIQKKEGQCIYAILGGSGAMSWGVESGEERISYQLERLLNTYLINEKCREFKVLNMGIGSHTFYQAVQIYLYYKKLLDGVIFYGGFNECAHGALLPNDDPIEFPVHNLYSSLKAPSPLIMKLSDMQSSAGKWAKFLIKHPHLVYSSSVRFIFTVKMRRIGELQRRIQVEEHQTDLPCIKSRLKIELRNRFPKITPSGLMQSFDYDNPDIPKAIEEILPIIYTEPLINAYAVSKTNNALFLNIIQPFMYITGKDTNWKELNYASYYFQKCSNEKLIKESKKLKNYGINTYDLNEICKGELKKEYFIDQVHLKKEGTEVIARSLFEIIKKEWYNDEQDI